MPCIDQVTTDDYALYLGDCVEVLHDVPDASIGYSIFSPPFASMYTYSANEFDMGNARDYDSFFNQFGFLIDQLRRVIMPGRDISVHCMDLPTSKSMHGYIGLYDFPGEIIRAFQSRGFIFHSKATIWKDPVTAMQRTKALGLLHKTVRGNAAMCRMGVPDYLITMRAPGESERVTHDAAKYPVSRWQKIASPVWMDINPSDTLQFRSARENDDERHICPLQLEVIRRGIELWTNRGDVVLSPFMGIGSEGYVALELGRKFIGVELKRSYFDQAVRNMEAASSVHDDLFFATRGDTT